MGRAMIIICAGVLISLGIISLSTSRQGLLLTEKSATYAYQMAAKNTAHTAIQIAMQKINENPDWVKSHDSTDKMWKENIGGAEIEFYIEPLHDTEGNGYWEDDSLRMISKATYINGHTATVTSLYLKAPFSSFVPDFTGSMQFASNNVVPSFDGSASISGTDESGQCSELGIPNNVPEVSVDSSMSDTTYSNLQNEFENLKDSPGSVEKVSDLNYEPTDELIERLENSGNAIKITPDYKDPLGSATNPGVFFIEEGANLTGAQSEGYGIMIVRRDASLQYDGTLDVAGNFKFHGLVIFENAFAFNGKGTPTIYGSVLIGHTQEFLDDPTVSETEKTMEVDLNGNIHLQYDCQGQNYAKMAAASAVEQNKYTRVVTFEQVGF